jgi:hypothetical protein
MIWRPCWPFRHAATATASLRELVCALRARTLREREAGAASSHRPLPRGGRRSSGSELRGLGARRGKAPVPVGESSLPQLRQRPGTLGGGLPCAAVPHAIVVPAAPAHPATDRRCLPSTCAGTLLPGIRTVLAKPSGGRAPSRSESTLHGSRSGTKRSWTADARHASPEMRLPYDHSPGAYQRRSALTGRGRQGTVPANRPLTSPVLPTLQRPAVSCTRCL